MNPFLRTFLDGPIRVIVLRMHRSTLSVQLSLQNSDRRKKYLDGDFEKRLKEICLEVANEARFEIRELECDRNHIHPLIDVDPQFGAHRAVKHMKGRSSRILRQEFAKLRQRLPTLRSNSYFVCTVGSAPISSVRYCIESQKERSAHG